MDELHLIRETLNPPSPSARATVQARNRLTSAINASQSASTHHHPSRSLRWALGSAAVFVGIAAVVLATAAMPPKHSTPGIAAQTPGDPAAHMILLAAANRAESQTTGEYWHVESIAVTGPYKVGAPPNQYNLVKRSVTANWIPQNPQEVSWIGSRDLGYRPYTEADQQAWQRAGSPKQWDVSADDSATGSRRLTMTAGKAHLHPADAPATYLQDLGGFDLAQIQQLPPDPAKLRALLLTRITAAGFTAQSWGSNSILFSSLAQLLLDAPAPPSVRAAAFTVLAGIPGVHSTGAVKDADGRPGLGIELAHASRDRIVEYHQLILDPATDVIMASNDSASGGEHGTTPIKNRDVVIVTAGWTDQKPEPPTGS